MIWIGGAATLVALAVLILFATKLLRLASQEHVDHTAAAFLHGAALLLALLSVLGVLWTAFPIALLRVRVPPTG